MTIDEILDRFGGILASSFGDRALIGFLFGMMQDITPQQCYEFVRDNKDLFSDISEQDWERIRNVTNRINLDTIDTERLIKEFRKFRPDLLQVIVNYPDGIDWVERQVTKLKSKLSLTSV